MEVLETWDARDPDVHYLLGGNVGKGKEGMKFPSPHHAFAFAYEILDCWHAGKAFDPDPEQFRGGTGVMGTVHRAMDVMMIADKFDPGVLRQRGRIDREKSWFYLIYVDQPVPHFFTPNEQWHLDKAICAFCEALAEKKLAEKNGCKAECKKGKGGGG